MKQKLLAFLLLGIMAVSTAFAQNRTITGKVVGADDGLPLPGVSVRVKGGSQGTTTGMEGNFTLNVPAGTKALTFTYIGYATKEVALGTASSLSVRLESDAKQLSEVVVTGYGVQQKREIGGSIAQVSGKDFENQPIASLDKALQGRAAGVVVQSNNGIPGGGINVRVRGVGSFTAGTQPLYVVDGVQMSGETFGGFTQANTLAGINPNDIESIEVLKDAATASIYGAQAANGVVLITTKKGKAGKTKLGFNYYTGRSEVVRMFDVLNSQEYIQLRTEAFQNANPTATAAAVRSAVLGEVGQPATATDAEIAALPTYDWQRESFGTGIVSNYELSATGGNEKTAFYVSGAYNAQDAVITKADFKRGVFKVNLDHKATDKLFFNSNLNLSTFSQAAPFSVSGSFLGSPAFSSSMIIPTNPIYNADGTFYGLPGSGQVFRGILNQNIAANNAYNISNQRTNQLIGAFTAGYNFTPTLTFKSFYSLEYRTVGGKNFRDPRTNDAYARKGYGEVFNDVRNNFLTTQTLNYNKTFGENHKLAALAGFEYRSDNSSQIYAFGDGYPTPQFTNIGATANPLDIDETSTGFKRMGVFTRLSYSFKGKYNVGASLRYDGSSRFGEDHLFGYFPGVTAAWNINEENFLKGVNWLDGLKLRASFGQAGNDRIGNFDARGLYGNGGIYGGGSGIAPISLANPDLRWEKATTYDLGLDFSVFQSRISGGVTAFLKRSSDLLLAQPLSTTSGFSSITTNVGAIDNRGLEVELNTINVQTKGGFKWASNFNFTVIENEIKSLYGGLTQLPSNPAVRVGWDLGAIYSYRYAGVNPATGRPFWYDANGNPTYSPNASTDRVNIGSTLPKYTGGFTNNFSYKGFDLDFMFQYNFGQRMFDSQVSFLSENGRRSFNTLKEVYDRRWTTPGQITDVSRPFNGGSESQGVAATTASSWLYNKTDYIRLKTVQFGYNFPASITNKIKVSNLRLYAQGTNLLTFTDYPGYDPEFYDTSGNNNAGAIPQSKNVTFGLQVGF